MWTALFLKGWLVFVGAKSTGKRELSDCISQATQVCSSTPPNPFLSNTSFSGVTFPMSISHLLWRRGSWRIPDGVRCPQRRERALEELQAWRLLSETLNSRALLALHVVLPRSSWSWMDSLLLFNSLVLLGSDGWGTVGQSHGWESHRPSFSPAREVLWAS